MKESGSYESTPTAFETVEQKQKRLALERKEAGIRAELDQAAERQAAERQAARNLESAKRSGAEFDIELARREEEEAARAGEQHQAQLADVRRRAAELRYAVEGEPELKNLLAAIDDSERELIGAPLMDARPDTVARLTSLRARAALWPRRKILLQEQLAQADAGVAELESGFDRVKAAFQTASDRLRTLLGKQ